MSEGSAAAGGTLGNLAARGVFITLGGQGLRIVIQVLSVVILARLLSPQDYGLLAMVTAIIGVAELFRDFGLSSAAVQAPTLSTKQRDNLFWINSCLGFALSLAIFFGAPIIADLYHQPELDPIARVLAWMFLVNGVATQYRADLTRRLKFLRLAVADSVSPAVALGVAVTFALNGAGYWSLVAQQLTQFVVMFAIVLLGARWVPGAPSPSTPMDGMIRFGWHLVSTQLVGYFSKNSDSFIIGMRFGPSTLGLYNRAFQLLMVPLNQVRAPSTTVALPVLSRLRDEQERYSRFVERGQLALGYTLVAGLGLVAGAALPVTTVFLGGKWLGLAPVLSLLAAAGAFQTLAYVGYWVYLSQGLTRYLFRYSIAEAAVTVGLLLLGSQWGIVGVAAGYAVAQALNWPLSFWWLSRYATIPLRRLYGGAARITLVAAAICVAAHLASSAIELPLLALMAAGGAAVAVLLIGTAVPLVRRDLMSVLNVGRRALQREKVPA
jgi:PST family polysaccharide transporter